MDLPISLFCSLLLAAFCFSHFAMATLPSASSSNEDPCGGDGWRHWPAGQKCVKLNPARTGWNMAEINCGFQGGHHISVRDVHENHFMAELAHGIGPIWLGAAQFGQSRDYVWVDGTPFGTFEHWQNDVRPPFHRGRKCVKLDSETGAWVQSCCRVPAASICQRPVPKVPGPIQEDLSTLSKDERDNLLKRQ